VRWYAVVLALVLPGCAALAPPPSHPFPAETPPALLANGVSGSRVSWCWKTACADGAPDFSAPGSYPEVGVPITLQPTLPLSRILVRAVQQGIPQGIPLTVEGTNHGRPVGGMPLTVSEVPAGKWTMLMVDVSFQAGGSAGYAWELAKPESSP
jgi:hypothetical protein